MKKKPTSELHILHYGAPVLRRTAARIKKTTPELKALTEEMQALMHRAHGVGLAATQIGLDKQLAVIDVGEGPMVLVNPRLVKAEGEETMVEGCLSLPGLYGEVKRAAKVVVQATDLSGKPVRIKAEGFLARALQHEIDHLHGRLFVDRADESTLHWLREPAPSAAGEAKSEPLRQPTTLADALRVFLARAGK